MRNCAFGAEAPVFIGEMMPTPQLPSGSAHAGAADHTYIVIDRVLDIFRRRGLKILQTSKEIFFYNKRCLKSSDCR